MIGELTDVMQYEWAQRALITSGLVGIMCGLLGCFIMLRNMALIGDALSHAILPGVVAGFIIAGHSVLAFFTGSVIAGLVAAILITWIQRNVKSKEDAAIGIVFTTMFAIGVIGISFISRQQGVHLDMKDFLFGNVLGISTQDVILTGLICGYVLCCLVLFYRFLFITTFQEVIARTMGISSITVHYFLMLLLSFAVVASLQSVGVILVIAMLIIPASTAYLLSDRLGYMLVVSSVVGLISTISGLVAAILLETTPGPAMTVAAALIYGLTIIFSPSRGLIAKYYRKREKQSKILREDILKKMVKLQEKGKLTIESLKDEMKLSRLKLNLHLNKLARSGYIIIDKQPELTAKGLRIAYDLVRAHRLWETYLVEKLGLEKDQIHEQAEKFEHLLPEQFVDKMNETLGYPIKDPHGSPIPQMNRENKIMLDMLETGQHAVVVSRQDNESDVVLLWQKGLTPNTSFQFMGVKKNMCILQLGDQTIPVDKELSARTEVAVLK